MRPWHDATEYALRSRTSAANLHASMRPWHDATEYGLRHGPSAVADAASMRPWHDATEYCDAAMTASALSRSLQ